MTDASGGRLSLGYDDATGLLSSIGSASGAVSRVAWREGPDGVARASRVSTTDASGAELSSREWAPAGEALSSGWPVYSDEADVFRSGDPAYRYRTVLSDGATRVVSEYNSLHALISRRMTVSTPSGEVELQARSFTYPGTESDGVPDPASLPANWARPTVTATTFRDLAGGSRTTTERAEFDDVGRPVSHTAVDGTITLTDYDEEVSPRSPLPIGLRTAETVTAPDGQRRITRHTLNDERTAVVAIETLAPGDAPPDEGAVIAYAELDVEADGRVTEQRAFPAGDRAATPQITRWTETVDLATGTRTSDETVGAGTPAEATTTVTESLVHGGVLSTTGPMGTTVRTTYDALGRPVAGTDASGRSTLTVHETAQADGRNATTVTGPDGVSVTETRDPLGRTTRVTDNVRDGRVDPAHSRVVESRAYPEPGVLDVTDAWGATTRTRQDVFGRPVERAAPNGLVQLTRYDDVAMTVTTALTPTGRMSDAEQVSTTVSDESGRAVEESGTRRDGEPVPTVTRGYDGFGRPTSTADGTLGTGVVYDARGDAITTTLSSLRPAPVTSGPTVASRRFDGFGNSVEKVLSDGATERTGGARTIDALGRTTGQADQLGRVTTTEYTPDGLVSRIVAGSGQQSERTYHPVTRVLETATVTSPVGAPVRTAYEHDPVTDLLTAVYDPADRAGTEIRYEYDAHRNPLTVTYPDGKTVRYRYDAHGRRTRVTDVSDATTTLEHTPFGVLIRAAQHDAEGRPMADVTYAHDAYGRVETLTRGNGVVTDYAFTSASQIASERTRDATGRVLSERAYTYDARGNLTERIDVTHDADEAETSTTAYTYDAYDRLTGSSVDVGDEQVSTTVYELTVSGDIRSEIVTTAASAPASPSPSASGETRTVHDYEYSPLGELTGHTTTTRTGPGAEAEVTRRTQTYDPAGNLTHGRDGAEYTYDALNRRVTETTAEGVAVHTTYWADGSRRARATTADGQLEHVTAFYWDGDTLVNDTHTPGGAAAGTSVASYLIGDGRHSRSIGAVGTRYLGSDRHSNVTDLTDESGAVVARFAYSDYGVQAPADDLPGGFERTPFGYAGEYTDEHGSQHLGDRVYDPESARFTTMDTEALHNLFAFADLNPIMKIDPTGRFSQEDLIRQVAVIGASLIVFALGAVATAFNPTLSMIVLGLGGVFVDLVAAGLTGMSASNNIEKEFIADRDVNEVLKWGEIGLVGVGAAIMGGMFLKAFFRAHAIARATMRKAETELLEFVNGRSAAGGTAEWFVLFSNRVNTGGKVVLEQGSVVFTSRAAAERAAKSTGEIVTSVQLHATSLRAFGTRSRMLSIPPPKESVNGPIRPLRARAELGHDAGTAELGPQRYGLSGSLADTTNWAPGKLTSHMKSQHPGADVALVMDGPRTRVIVTQKGGVQATVREALNLSTKPVSPQPRTLPTGDISPEGMASLDAMLRNH